MMGGVNWPPSEATASTAPASSAVKPERFINGIVIVPVLATLATVLPDSMPMNPLLMMDSRAGLDRDLPAKAVPTERMSLTPPVAWSIPTYTMNTKTVVAESPVNEPKTP